MYNGWCRSLVLIGLAGVKKKSGRRLIFRSTPRTFALQYWHSAMEPRFMPNYPVQTLGVAGDLCRAPTTFENPGLVEFEWCQESKQVNVHV